MPQIPDKSMANVKVKGPFWSADVEVIKLAEPQKNWAFRNLFLDNTPRRGLGQDKVYLPGTLLLLCRIRQVQISPTPQQSYYWNRESQEKLPTELTVDAIRQLLTKGQLSLLLVQANSEAWPADCPCRDDQAFFPNELICLAGEIHLDALKQQNNNAKTELFKALNLEQVANGLQGREGAARLLSEVSVHSSGLSIFGKTKLPWQEEKISAPFQVAKLLPDLAPNNRQFRLTLEKERLTETEQITWRKAWQQLSIYLNPKNPLNSSSEISVNTPNWVTLEITNPLDIPRLYWQIPIWKQTPELHFAPDDFSLLLSDQQPYDQQNPPTSLARFVLGDIAVKRQENSDPSQASLEIVVKAGSEGITTGQRLNYIYEKIAEQWHESFTFSDLKVAFNPIEVPQFLRKNQNLSVPEWLGEDEPIQPAVLWGFMPLENGWAQLPVPNLTEQIYLDSGLAKFTEVDNQTEIPKSLIQGAVSLGNDRPEVLKEHSNEQPWNVTLTNAQRLQEGRWILKKVTDSEGKVKFQVTRVTLSILDPEVTLNGIFWLSTGKPTPEDALPDLQNWISGVRSLPLKTIKPELDLFPNPAIVTLEKLEFSLRPQPTQPASTELPSALLKAWNFAYEADEVIFGKMVERKILPADTFSQYFPLIWQRHATLPMVQALPLTQTQSPPNYPSASRQLVPFELGTANSQDGKFAVPKDWFFGVSGESGAASWPVLMSKAQPAREWKSLFDLPLVSLSIPGVVLDPKANAATTGLTPDEATQLPVQYRFDLPYTDEINALAQLPKIPRNPDEVSPLPDSPPPEPPKPLTRETFAEHWQHLSELASLSSVDATAAFVKQGEQTVIQHLIEPFDWSVEPTFDLGPYPGSLNLQNGVAIALSKETALRGISGKFVETDNGQITGTVQADNPYIIEAGSMAAHADGNGGFRDQRGLVRSATIATTKLIKTPITFHKDKGESEAYELISALDTVNLQIGEQHSWKIWFRDLPVQVETGSFTRQSTVSEQAEDINDPEAFSREHNFLTGYEWRLAEAEDKPDDFVSIFNLRFYPLTLEQVSIQGEQIEKLTIIGRLQLPLTSGGELKEFSNAVRLTFEPNPTLKLTAVELEARPAPDAALPGTFKIEIDERSQTWVLSWTGPMTPAEETALQTLPGDPDFKLGINKLIKQVRQQKSPNPTAKFTQAISYISPGSEMGEWPLALQSDEASDAPRLLWKKISLNSDQNRIDVENIQLNFFLFGVEWSIKLDESEEETAGKIVWSTESKKLSFSQTESDKLIEGTYTFPELATLEPLSSEDLKLVIDVASNEFNHKASLLLSVELGRERVTDGLQVLYTFAEGDGTTVKDVSGVGEPLNLIIENPAAKTWLPGGGLAINAPTIVKSAGAAKKLTQACKATNEITIEAWIKPASTATPKAGIPARIVTLAQDGPNGNISLQQGLWDNKQASDFYGVRLRTTTTGNNGEPLLVTPPGTLKTDLTHVVYTRDAAGVARLYINGVKQANTTIGGDFSNWDANYRLALADELSRERYWLGEYHLVAIYSCALSAAEVRQNYQAGSKITSIQERSAFEAKVRFLLAGANTQQNTNVLWESASLFRDMEIGVNARSILFTENALQFQWQSYTPKYSNLQLLPGMHVNSSEAPGFAALTFETDSEQGDIPKLRLKTAFIEALVSCQWGTFLQTNPISSDQTQQLSDVQAQVYASSAGDVVFGYTAQWQEQKASWNESLLLNGFLEIKNLISWPKEMSIKPEGNLTKLTLPSALTTTGQPQALKHIRHTIRILLNQHLIPAEVLVVGKGELLFQLAKNQSWQFLAVVEHQLIDILPGTQLTLENDRRWTTVQEVRLTLPETFKRFLSAQSNISTTDPVEGINALENANSGYLAAKLRAQLAGGDTPELDKLSADTLLVEASAPHWVRKEAIAPASATTLQFLPNGSQLGILSNPQDYAPSDPQAPEWLLLTMPFLGRLQDKNTDGLELLSGQPPTNTTTLSSLQIDPIICLTTKPLSDLSLALNFSSWGNNATVEIAISNFDTAVGRTWSRLDPLSLEENWFRLQNPLTEPQPTGLQSVMATLPDTPARLSRSTALNYAFDAFREAYPPVAAPDHNPPTQAVAMSPDGQRAVSGSDDGTVKFWDLQNGQLLQILKGHTDKIRSVAITPDRQRAVSGSDDGTVKFWDLDNGQVLRTLQGHTNKVRSVDMTSDRQRAISGSDDGTVKVWNLDNGQLLRTLQGHTKGVTSVAITPDRKRAVSGSDDGTVKFWDLDKGQLLQTLQGHTKGVTSVAITPDRQRAVSGSEDGTVKFWDLQNGQLLRTLQGHTDKVRSVAITPDRQRAVSGSDDSTVKFWDLDNGQLLLSLQGHTDGVGAVAITPDRQKTISGSDDGSVKLWNLNNGQVLRVLEGPIERGNVASERILWRQNSLLAMQGVGRDRKPNQQSYSWYLTGVQILSSGLLNKPKDSTTQPSRHVAATLLPAQLKLYNQANPVPLSFAVSPYLGLEFKPAKTSSNYEPLLVSTELLCLDKASGSLLPVASHFWEELQDIDERSLIWAKETHLRLSPESPVAIVRSREIKKNINPEAETEALLTTTYGFAIVLEIKTPQRLAKRVFRLRSSVTKLRFSEGQFGGNQLPTNVHPFEIAPPQTIGVQPLYLTERPETKPPETKPQEATTPKKWPWGLSAIRLSVQYTEDKQAAIGSLGKTAADPLTLWWQAPQHMVQYRSALSANGPTAGLPPRFRASAIKSLLPVLPAPPLPSINEQEQFNSPDRKELRYEFQRWQPVLPGAVRYLMVGDRPGTMFAIRNQLLRHNGIKSENNQSTTGAVMVSGSIPVQHRMPRPVPLPDNQDTAKNTALQPWASYFEVERNLLATPSPADEAFFAEFGTPPNQQPARRLQMILHSPAKGAVNAQWDGELVFDIKSEQGSMAIANWNIEVEVTDAGKTFKYSYTKPKSPDNTPEAEPLNISFTPDQKESLQEYLVNKVAGETLTVTAKVKPIVQPPAVTDNFSQTLSFELRIIDETAFPLPLQPYFIHFEDPEYNRQLASPAAHASGNVKVLTTQELVTPTNQELVTHTVKLSVDRREYNPDSVMALRYDWDDTTVGDKFTAQLKLQRINSEGVTSDLLLPSPSLDKLLSGTLIQFSLADLKLKQNPQPESNKSALLQPGETLQLKLLLTEKGKEKPVDENGINLSVSIVKASVIPTTEAAYALLRQRGNEGSPVECVRFAWSPEPTRVELVCAEDLRTEVVRRRAVFHWNDSVRPKTPSDYTIQKITQTGSTHFPTLPQPNKDVTASKRF